MNKSTVLEQQSQSLRDTDGLITSSPDHEGRNAKERFIDPAMEATRNAGSQVRSAAHKSREWVHDELDQCVGYARRKPIITAAVVGTLGLAIGIGIGAAFTGSSSRSSFLGFPH